MLLTTLGASLLANLLTGKGVVKEVKETFEQVRIFNAASSFN